MVRNGNNVSICIWYEMVMVQNGYGTKWQWYEMVMVRKLFSLWYEMVMVRNDCNSMYLYV
jgi:hypothetical protein